VRIALFQELVYNKGGIEEPERRWQVYDDGYPAANLDFCLDNPEYETTSANVAPDNNLGYPDNVGPFSSHGMSNCYYSGPESSPGQLTCDGGFSAGCARDPYVSEMQTCGQAGAGSTMYPDVWCYW
jgi:hypothetical protein